MKREKKFYLKKMEKTKNKNKYISFLKDSISKLVVVFLVFSIFSSVSNINQTYAYFNDEASMEGSTFTAGTLEIGVDYTDSFNSDLNPGDTTSVTASISNLGSLDSQYIVETNVEGSDTSACDYITMQVTTPSTLYTGSIKDFASINPEPTTISSMDYSFTVDANASPSVWGKTCTFKWRYTAWQNDFADSSSGFSSVKEKLSEINIGKVVVMNEILPNPEGLDTQLGLQGEWVELYNNGDVSIDLTGWKIKDLIGNTKIISSSNTMNGRTIIGPKGSYLEWVVVYMNDDMLNNGGDAVYFTDQSDNIIDQYTYESSVTDSDSDSNSTGGGDNDNPSGSETAGNEGKSYARLPVDGTGDWVDPIPTPGEPNIDGEVELLLENDSPVILDQNTEDTTAKASDEDPLIEPEVTELEPVIEETIVLEELLPPASLPEEIPLVTEAASVTE